jgi:hypothetical protein
VLRESKLKTRFHSLGPVCIGEKNAVMRFTRSS